MFVQIRLEREGLFTILATEILVGRMRLHVSAQIRAVRERLAAMGAAVRFFARMRSQMALEQPRARELLTANAATVRQFVCEDVHGQRGHTDVGLAARHALLRRLRIQTSVGLLVTRQVARGGVLFSAQAAGVTVRFLRGVRFLVRLVRQRFGLGFFVDHSVEFLKEKNVCLILLKREKLNLLQHL